MQMVVFSLTLDTHVFSTVRPSSLEAGVLCGWIPDRKSMKGEWMLSLATAIDQHTQHWKSYAILKSTKSNDRLAIRMVTSCTRAHCKQTSRDF